ncbi:hypothetical protein F5Y16DRAFT_357912 [Xylariaceae sp. FL0255]|nr:hypothetical protein F5Y16DRAFT_357912 [Xylariaceae sp. FL0255]
MQFKAIALSFFVAAVTAQNSTSESLTDLVSELPTCAISCFESGASAANCSVTDFSCLCGSGKQTFISNAGLCLLSDNSCTDDQINNATTVASEICEDIGNNPSSTDVASASAIVASAVAAATSATATPDVAMRPEFGYGILGAAAAAAAFAL